MVVGSWYAGSPKGIRRWSFVLGRSSLVVRPWSFVLRPWSFVLGRSSLVVRPWSFVLGRSSTVLGPSSTVLRRSTIYHLLSTIYYLPLHHPPPHSDPYTGHHPHTPGTAPCPHKP